MNKKLSKISSGLDELVPNLNQEPEQNDHLEELKKLEDNIDDQQVREQLGTFRKSKVGRPKKDDAKLVSGNWVRTTIIIEKDKLQKLDIIVKRYGAQKKDLLNLAVTEIIKRYEKENGVIDVEAESKKDMNKLFK